MVNTTSNASHQGKKLVIFGAAGFAREVAWLVAEVNRAVPGTWNPIGFFQHEDNRIGQVINGLPIVSLDEVSLYLPDLYAVVAIGDPRIRERAVREAENVGCLFATIIHPATLYDPSTVKIGAGTIICAHNVLTVNIVIGDHVIINLDCTIGHDSVIEDYVTISPGCHLSGHTTVKRRAFLGTGTVTVEKHEIGARAILGAGAVVTEDIPPGVVAMGVPAKVKKQYH